MQALQQLLEMSINSNLPFGKILQGSKGWFMEFFVTLQVALSRQIDSDEATVILLWQLAFTNAIEDYRKAYLLSTMHILVTKQTL